MYDAWKTRSDRDENRELEPLSRCVACEELFDVASLDADGLCLACGADREVAEPDHGVEPVDFGLGYDDAIDELPF